MPLPLVTLSCGGATDQNGTLFVNPEYPDTGNTSRSCYFSVKKASPDVTQIRLDFLEFTVSEGGMKTAESRLIKAGW